MQKKIQEHFISIFSGLYKKKSISEERKSEYLKDIPSAELTLENRKILNQTITN